MELNIECAINLCHLFAEPNISSPLNTQAAQLWSNQEGGFYYFSFHIEFVLPCNESWLTRISICLFCRIPENGGEIVQASNSSLALFF